MSDLKNETNEVIDTVETDNEVNEELEKEVETKEETEDDKFSDLTEDDYFKLQERLKKAESTIVKYKKWAKKSSETSNWDAITKADLDLIRFVDKNPWYEWKEDELKSYMKKWLSITEAKKLVEPDEVVENRAKTKSSSISAWETWWSKTVYSIAEIENMSQSDYNRVMTNIESWKAVIK